MSFYNNDGGAHDPRYASIPHVQQQQGAHPGQAYHGEHYEHQQYHHNQAGPDPERYNIPPDQQYNMAGHSNGSGRQPQLGATFYPGGYDDFAMPDLISPAPQRIMPEVPSKMQDGLANLEMQSPNAPGYRVSTQSTASSGQTPYDPYSSNSQRSSRSSQPDAQRNSGPGFTASYLHTNAAAYQNLRDSSQSYNSRQAPDSPKFSPFPKLHNPAPNVPLSDEEKETVLERARPLVLKATDPELQLAWAQDALSWCEVASQSYQRQQEESQPGRPMTPKVEHQLREDALSIVNFLAEQGHPKADFIKSMWLEFGKFKYRVDKKEAFMGYRRASHKRYARAEYRLGMQYEASNNSAKAIEHYEKGVSMGDSASNYRLGMMTLLGQHDTPQNYQVGINLIRFAADTADENAPQGAYVYGMLLARELPNIKIPEQFLAYDQNNARLFIEKAAYLGFAKAQLKMAQAYELCQLGCEFEPALSLHYNALAARQGEPEADMAISKWFLCGYDGVFEKNEELAFTYASRAAETKMATAEFALGYFYEIGIYVTKDLRQATSWYEKAAEHGNKDALGRIESIRSNITFSKSDHEKVAISRIKSNYGSQRGGRPDRFKQRAPPMPTMAEDRMNVPNHNNRRIFTAPYPEDDMVEANRLQVAGPQADRPSSAFGIRPSYDQGMRPIDPKRPSSSMGNVSVPAGRGNHATAGGWEPQVPNYAEPHYPPVDSIGSQYQKPLPNLNDSYPIQMSTPNQGYATKPLPQPSYQLTDSPQQTPIPRRDPAANQFVRPERGSSMTPSNTVPMRVDNTSRASQRPPQQTMSSQGQGARTSTLPSGSSVPPPSAPPRKQGPSTFEEMDIPVKKDQGDCYSNMGTRSRKRSISNTPSNSCTSSPAPSPSRKPKKVKVDKDEKPKVDKAKPTVKKEKVDKAEKKSSKADAGDGKAKKEKTVTGDEAIELILGYLKVQNRPYSATEVSANLHGKVTKTVADKLLKEMMNRELIMGKGTNGDNKGSQWVFWALQVPSDTATPAELIAMDETINSLRTAIPILKSELKSLSSRLSTLKSALTTSELQSKIQAMERENQEKRVKLEELKTGAVTQVTKEEMERAEKEWAYWTKKRKERKGLFEGLEYVLLEGMTREEIWERAGIESDD
ncbi:hypothetical protein B7494_g8558 [Chlorociboria aeruginascens]|nr:hypothetical protein B7494_g8558 [Chlorociboria aeruginascens]